MVALCGLLFCLPPAQAQEGQQKNPYQSELSRLHAMFAQTLPDWKAHQDNLAHGEDPSLNDADWSPFRISEPWQNGPVWFRRWVEIPQSMGGYNIRGLRVRLDLGVSSEGSSQMRVFFNGALAEMADEDTQQPILLTEKAEPGQKVLVAINVPAATAPVHIASADLLVDYPPGRPDPALMFDEIRSAQAMIAGLSRGQPERAKQLDDAVKTLDFASLQRGDQQAFENSLKAAQEKLRPLGDWAKQFSVRAVANSHIDMAWLWPWTETVEVVRNTFGTVLQLMRQYPGFIYAQSAAQDYVWMEEKYPDLFKEIQQRVKEGRWEIVGGMWVEPDLNMPSGESLVRQILVGKRYFQQKFGVEVRIGWNPDSFGYNWQLPQIYKRSGLDYFVTQKMDWNDTTKFPYKLFWWESPDGSRILTYFPHDYVNEIQPLRISQDVAAYVPKTGLPEIMHLYGIGDHGGGPTRTMLDSAQRWQNGSNIFPQLTFGTAQSFFDDVEKNAAHLEIPVWNNELYFQYHRGVMTTQSETKKRIRQSEELLLNAEKFSSLAMLDGQPYAQEELQNDWKKVLFDQFHDVMPGSGIAINYVDAARDLGVVRLSGDKILHSSLKTLTARVNTEGEGVPVVLFNPLSWARTDVTEAEAQFPSKLLPGGGIEVRDSAGTVLPSSVFSRDDITHTVKIRFLAKSVPAMGYAVFHLVPVAQAASASTTLKASAEGMENEFVRLKVDSQTGCITSLLNKHDGHEALAPGACGNLLQTFVDLPKEYDAWNIDANFEDHMWDLKDAEEVKLIENTPVRAVIRVKKKFQNSAFVQDICMYPGVPRVDVNMQADWHEKHILLKVAFPVSVQSNYATYEIPYGNIQRPTTRNTPEEKAMFEVPALRWGDLSDTSHGLSLLNASKYGYDAKGNVIRLSLLRSPAWPDAHADEGFHEFTYALYPHTGDWKAAETERRGFELNFPLIPVTTEPRQGVLPASHSFGQIEPGNVILTAVKKAEDNAALIFRFFEFEGKTSEVHLHFPEAATQAAQVNLMEKQDAPLSLQDGGKETTVTVHPYEIVTVKVWFGKSSSSQAGGGR
ncbi:MAG: alpha-mannosidase [Terriglobia bacterium]|jgi:alpha-mannosidase